MLTSKAQSIIAANAVLLALASISVGLRVQATRQRLYGIGLDDLFIIGALLFSAFLVVTIIVGAAIGGFGKPFEDLSEATTVVFLKILFVLQFWYIIAVALVKLSVLYFYGRLFSGTQQTPWGIRIMQALTIAWLVSFLFATFFQVWPLWCNWTTCNPTTNYPVMYALSSATDIVLDIGILCLPISYIRKLNMSGAKKIGITAVFGLGIFCTIASVARLAYTVEFVEVNIKGDYAINFDNSVVNIIMWSGIEACASTLCANLPCYGPLAASAPRLASKIESLSGRVSSKPYRKSSHHKMSSLEEIVRRTSQTVETTIQGSRTPRADRSDLELNAIEVETTVSAHSKSRKESSDQPAGHV